MRLSLTLAAPLMLILAVGGVQAQSLPTSQTSDGQACLEFNDSASLNSVNATQEAAARGLPLCDDLDDSVTGSIRTSAPGYVVPQSSVEQSDSSRN